MEKLSRNFVHEQDWTVSLLDIETQAFSDDLTKILDKTHPLRVRPLKLHDLKWFGRPAAEAKKKAVVDEAEAL